MTEDKRYKIIAIVVLTVVCWGGAVLMNTNSSSKRSETLGADEFTTEEFIASDNGSTMDEGWRIKYFDALDKPARSKERAYYYRRSFYRNGTFVSDSLVTEFYLTGEKKEEKHLLSESPDIIDGEFRFFHRDGSISSICHYVNGLRNGDYIGYDELGRVIYSGKYVNGKKEGKHQRFRSAGVRSSIVTYKNDVVDGYCEFYDDNGKLSCKGNYRESREGTTIHYHPYGTITTYYPNGKIRAKGDYANGQKTGVWYLYDENGKMSKIDYSAPVKQTPVQTYTPKRDSDWDRGYNYGWNAGYQDAMDGNGMWYSYNDKGKGGSFLKGYTSGYEDGYANGRE